MYYVEMYDNEACVTTEEWRFDSLSLAQEYFDDCVNSYLEEADKKHIEWILFTFDEDGDYIQLDSYCY